MKSTHVFSCFAPFLGAAAADFVGLVEGASLAPPRRVLVVRSVADSVALRYRKTSTLRNRQNASGNTLGGIIQFKYKETV